MKTVLISGAGVAGSALAHWLHRDGVAVTVVEHTPGRRRGGQAVDIRGTALDVVERMGLLDRVRAHRTRMRGMSVLDGDGREVHRSTETTFSSGRLASEDIELLREDLVHVLHEQAGAGVEFVFDDRIRALDQDEEEDEEGGVAGGGGIRVTFERGRPRTFDLVVGADGLHSAVRRLGFGPEERFTRHLGMHLALFTADNFLGLDDWQLWLRDAEAGYGIYPVRDNTELRISFGFAAGPLPAGPLDTAAHKRLVADRMAALRWETPRLLKALWEASDFYSDAMTQVHMDRWSHGRTVLLGDAGYCASPLSGQGTGLALVGAHVLAAALRGAGDDHRAAFARYEERMRPFVALNQALAVENPGGPASEASVDRAKRALALED
ncbi:FAD-dependent monooxygenase [Streptomyces noursei]|uniref:FAD-dependent monooxygenase n=1 Tax=Streptomyces noursei TaxID=1971 RepID=UPI0030EFB13E